MTPRERIEWCDLWVEQADNTSLPRLLLIGDSITRSYYPHVSKQLAGSYACARLATSKCVGDPLLLKELDLVLGEYSFEVIHLNNGLHGWDYDEPAYAGGLAQVLDFLLERAGPGTLLWASTTPVWQKGDRADFAPRTERVRERNRLAAGLAASRKIPVNDLFAAVADHPEYVSPDGVHFAESGQLALCEQVVSAIRSR